MVQVKNGKYECECECSRGRNELAKCQTGKLERSFLPHAPSDRGKIASFSHTSNFLHFFHLFPLQLQLQPQQRTPPSSPFVVTPAMLTKSVPSRVCCLSRQLQHNSFCYSMFPSRAYHTCQPRFKRAKTASSRCLTRAYQHHNHILHNGILPIAINLPRHIKHPNFSTLNLSVKTLLLPAILSTSLSTPVLVVCICLLSYVVPLSLCDSYCLIFSCPAFALCPHSPVPLQRNRKFCSNSEIYM